MLRAATSAARIRGFRRFGHQWPVTQVPAVHTRVFCAASYWETLKVGLEALRYSGEAIQKLQKFRSCKDELKEQTWPQTVKIKFQLMESQESMVVTWSPHDEYLHDVFKDSHKDIYDFDIYYTDRDGDEVKLRPTKSELERFLKLHSQPELKVVWRRASLTERVQGKIQEIKSWMCGGGAATEQAVKSAQDAVEANGGRIIPSTSRKVFLDHKQYQASEWEKVWPILANHLRLEEPEANLLSIAPYSDDNKGVMFTDTDGNRMRTTYSAYHVTQNDGKIDVLYGTYEASLEVLTPGTSFAMGNTIQHMGRLFTVVPNADPHGRDHRAEMCDEVVRIPGGWKIVDSSADGFDGILDNVIAKYEWECWRLATRGKEGIEVWISRKGIDPGTQDHDSSLLEELQVEGRFKRKNRSLRILIEQLPASSPELINNWKRFVEISAQHEWSKHMGLLPAGPS